MSNSSNPEAQPVSTDAPRKLLNINVGVLGHVDSGKTCLGRSKWMSRSFRRSSSCALASDVRALAVAALSTKLSTAALDKHPQSKERGITLDLGFSAFVTDLPPQLQHSQYTALQVSPSLVWIGRQAWPGIVAIYTCDCVLSHANMGPGNTCGLPWPCYTHTHRHRWSPDHRHDAAGDRHH